MSKDAYPHLLLPGKPGEDLLFLFHGTGGDERQFVDVARELLAEATLVAPRGDVSEGGAARFFRRTGEGVYDIADLGRATAKMSGFVEAHVGAASPFRVLGLGYSNGANILASVLFGRPRLFDRVALMHPLIPFEPQIADGLAGRRVLITAGRRDPICPPALTLKLESLLRDGGADVTLDWHDGGHEIGQIEIEAIAKFLSPQPATADP